MKDVAKKTIEKIEREQVKLDSLLAKREELTAGYQAKLAEVDESIKEQKKVIAALCEQEKTEKLAAIASMFNKNGVSVDDLLNAVANNDLYGLQEKLEGKETANPQPAAEPAVNENSSSDAVEDSNGFNNGYNEEF